MLLNLSTFKEHNLTHCQKAAIEALEPLIEGDVQFGILKGYAGTGKTFLTSLIVKHLIENEQRVQVLTPTGRAAKVLKSEFIKHNIELAPATIHSVIYSINPVDYSKQQLSLFADVKTNEHEGPCFYIIDESSMVGDEKRAKKEEGLNFGSGSLLHDIIEFVDPAFNEKAKILFVGDPGQLAPVDGSERTPALTDAGLRSILSDHEIDEVDIVSYELQEVLRQQEGSLIEFVSDVREAFMNKTSLPKNERQDVKAIPTGSTLEMYKEFTCELQCPEKCVILAHKNADVFQYNQSIRSFMGLGDNPIVLDDILLVRRNRKVRYYGELDISRAQEALTNGTFIQVVGNPQRGYQRTITIRGKEIQLQFWNVKIKRVGSDYEFDAVLLQNMLDASFWKDYRNQYSLVESAILVDFQLRMKEKHNLKPAKPGDAHYEEYSRKAERDPYLNAVRVNYGYAVTVHNAQGGEWDNVIVDPRHFKRELNGTQHLVSYARWVYTASTRSKKKLYFIKHTPEEVLEMVGEG